MAGRHSSPGAGALGGLDLRLPVERPMRSKAGPKSRSVLNLPWLSLIIHERTGHDIGASVSLGGGRTVRVAVGPSADSAIDFY